VLNLGQSLERWLSKHHSGRGNSKWGKQAPKDNQKIKETADSGLEKRGILCGHIVRGNLSVSYVPLDSRLSCGVQYLVYPRSVRSHATARAILVQP